MNRVLKQGSTGAGGIDEVGRGALAGPVVAAAVVLSPPTLPGVKDSKLLTRSQRNSLIRLILGRILALGIGVVGEDYILQWNIRNATRKAMEIAIRNLGQFPDVVIVDGPMDFKELPVKVLCVNGADRKVYCVAAASIIAKVIRDGFMQDYQVLYPEYHFSIHCGYGTRTHREIIEKRGLTPVHRMGFRPVAESLFFHGAGKRI